MIGGSGAKIEVFGTNIGALTLRSGPLEQISGSGAKNFGSGAISGGSAAKYVVSGVKSGAS